MRAIFRWHVSRKYGEEGLGNEGNSSDFFVTITPGTKRVHDNSVNIIAIKHSDDLDWWEEDEDKELEGWISEEALKQALLKHNIFHKHLRHPQSVVVPIKDRKIEEDMVFLQFVYNLNRFIYVWNTHKKKKGLHNLNGLIQIEGSKWLDFTQQARKMAADTYNKVLKASEMDIAQE